MPKKSGESGTYQGLKQGDTPGPTQVYGETSHEQPLPFDVSVPWANAFGGIRAFGKRVAVVTSALLTAGTISSEDVNIEIRRAESVEGMIKAAEWEGKNSPGGRAASSLDHFNTGFQQGQENASRALDIKLKSQFLEHAQKRNGSRLPEDPNFVTGLKVLCESQDGYCFGYIAAVLDMIRATNPEDLGTMQKTICLPKELSYEQLGAVFVSWSERNPMDTNDRATIPLAFALHEAFPCKGPWNKYKKAQ